MMSTEEPLRIASEPDTATTATDHFDLQFLFEGSSNPAPLPSSSTIAAGDTQYTNTFETSVPAASFEDTGLDFLLDVFPTASNGAATFPTAPGDSTTDETSNKTNLQGGARATAGAAALTPAPETASCFDFMDFLKELEATTDASAAEPPSLSYESGSGGGGDHEEVGKGVGCTADVFDFPGSLESQNNNINNITRTNAKQHSEPEDRGKVEEEEEEERHVFNPAVTTSAAQHLPDTCRPTAVAPAAVREEGETQVASPSFSTTTRSNAPITASIPAAAAGTAVVQGSDGTTCTSTEMMFSTASRAAQRSNINYTEEGEQEGLEKPRKTMAASAQTSGAAKTAREPPSARLTMPPPSPLQPISVNTMSNKGASTLKPKQQQQQQQHHLSSWESCAPYSSGAGSNSGGISAAEVDKLLTQARGLLSGLSQSFVPSCGVSASNATGRTSAAADSLEAGAPGSTGDDAVVTNATATGACELSDAAFITQATQLLRQIEQTREEALAIAEDLQVRATAVLKQLGPHSGLASVLGPEYTRTPVVQLLPLLIPLLEELLEEDDEVIVAAVGSLRERATLPDTEHSDDDQQSMGKEEEQQSESISARPTTVET